MGCVRLRRSIPMLKNQLEKHMRYSLNSLKGGYIGDYYRGY